MKVIFMGTPDFAVPTLEYLVNNGKHNIISVVTSVDKPRGRGRKIFPSSVKTCALSLRLPIIQPHDLSDNEFLQKVRSLAPDVFIIVAFRILPEELFSIPKYGAINLHASMLPEYRGAAPIQWALIRGEKKTGITTFRIDAGIDTGNILLQKEVEIQPDETAGELSARLAKIGAELIVETLDRLESDMITPAIQDSRKSSRAPKITPEILRIDWNKSAQDIVYLIRGLSPVPAAHTYYKNIELKIFRARALVEADEEPTAGTILKAHPKEGLVVKSGRGAVEVITIQREGKRQMPAAELLRGMHMREGDVFY